MSSLPKLRFVGARLTDGVGVLTPVPLSAACCGLLPALSVMLKVPVRLPTAVGVKVRLMVQVALAARLAGQLLVCAKSPLLLIPVMLSAALPVLVRVKAWAALVVFTTRLPNTTFAEDRLAPGTGVFTPVPLRVACCGLPLASSLTLRVPLRAPTALGVKVTVSVQLPPAAKLLGQLLWLVKSPLLDTALIFSAEPPLLVSVTVCEAVFPRVTLPNERLVGLRLAWAAPTPMPDRETSMGETGPLLTTDTLPLLLPAEVGVKLTLTLVFCPGARVRGRAKPEMLKAEPLRLAADTVTLA